MQDSQYIDIGKYLKDVRESLNLSVEQIAADLNIRARYLTAIEEHNLGELPSGVYLLGYVKNYAKYLSLDHEKLAKAYTLSYPILGQQDAKNNISYSKRSPSKAILAFSFATIAIIYIYLNFSLHDNKQISFKIAPLLPLPSQAWQDCLESDNPLCFFNLRTKSQNNHYNIDIIHDILTKSS